MHRMGKYLVAVLISGCAADHHRPSALERRDAIRTARELDYRSSEGFQTARWGMTVEEVRALLSEATPVGRNTLLMDTTIARTPAAVKLSFLKGRLAAVEVTFLEVTDVRPLHDLLRDLLSRKYGLPTEEQDTAMEAQRQVGRHRQAAALMRAGDGISQAISGKTPDPYLQSLRDAQAERNEEIAREQARAAQNDFTLRSKWVTIESIVTTAGQQSPNNTALSIQYESHVYAPKLAAERENARNADRDRLVNEL